MKKRTVISTVLCMTFTVTIHAAPQGVTVLSGQQRVWGYAWGGYWYQPDPIGDYANDLVTLTITDQTAGGGTVFHYSGDACGLFPSPTCEPPYVRSITRYFSVDPTHDYMMYVFLKSSADHDGPFSAAIQVDVVPVPGAVLLGTIGAGLVGWLRETSNAVIQSVYKPPRYLASSPSSTRGGFPAIIPPVTTFKQQIGSGWR